MFIGKNLDAAALRAEFAACLATPANLAKKLSELRFPVGTRVVCNMGDEDGWVEGTITMLMWRSDDMEPGVVAPYQARRLPRHAASRDTPPRSWLCWIAAPGHDVLRAHPLPPAATAARADQARQRRHHLGAKRHG